MARITLRQWREQWPDYIAPPDARDHERERTFLEAHGRYGARIHLDTAEALAAALEDELVAVKGHRLFLKLFAEFANALESLGALGWAVGRRRGFRLFLDGFLSYENDAPAIFYRRILEGELFGIHHRDITHTSAKHIIVGDWFIDDKTETCARWQAAHPSGIAVQWITPHNRKDGWTGRATNSWEELCSWVAP